MSQAFGNIGVKMAWVISIVDPDLYPRHVCSQIARICGVRRQTAYRWCVEERVIGGDWAKIFIRFSVYYGVDVGWLLYEHTKNPCIIDKDNFFFTESTMVYGDREIWATNMRIFSDNADSSWESFTFDIKKREQAE